MKDTKTIQFTLEPSVSVEEGWMVKPKSEVQYGSYKKKRKRLSRKEKKEKDVFEFSEATLERLKKV